MDTQEILSHIRAHLSTYILRNDWYDGWQAWKAVEIDGRLFIPALDRKFNEFLTPDCTLHTLDELPQVFHNIFQPLHDTKIKVSLHTIDDWDTVAAVIEPAYDETDFYAETGIDVFDTFGITWDEFITGQ